MSVTPVWDTTVRLDDTSGTGCSWRFSDLVTIITADTINDVVPALRTVEQLTQQGLVAAGFVAYEAAPALNPSLTTLPPREGFPLVWFSIFRHRHMLTGSTPDPTTQREGLTLKPTLCESDYLKTVGEIRDRIAQGECYQANYTFPCQATSITSPEAVYNQIIRSQKAPYCGLITTGQFSILSASPELFFKRTGSQITTRPMKGTAARGHDQHDDQRRAQLLAENPKEQAENLMIVDLLRNDLSMIAEVGSVRTERLFEVETYPTLHQMTSTISATLKQSTSLLDIFTALFPCGSVTGAPKRKTMEMLSELESGPRGVYCGAIGMVAPDGEAIFSVPIRTLVYDQTTDTITTGVGSGITWDSDPRAEREECHTKISFTAPPLPDAGLIESLRCEQGNCLRVTEHSERMAWSAQRLGIPFDPLAATALITEYAAGLSGVHKVRLLLNHQGILTITADQIDADNPVIRLTLSHTTVDPADQSLYLKLSDRSRYNTIRQQHPEADEVIIRNTRGELTEGTYTNIVVKHNGQYITPPLASGLLPGVMRSVLLKTGVLHEQVLYPDDLATSEELWVINSVRGWQRGYLIQE
jgi:para-aminobenzoate synthetase/4-amino-4-deoxychorismate lyase